MKHDEYHREFADRVIEQIRQGTAPWQKPWAPGERVLPANVDTDRSYRGGNSLHLAAVQQERGYGDVRWGTYRQIQARGGQVRKGETGTRILSFQDHKRTQVTDERGRPRRDAEGKRVYRYERLKAPFVRQYTVFNAEQADGLPARSTPTPEPLWKTHQQAERVLEDSGVPDPPRRGRPRLLQPEPRRGRAARARDSSPPPTTTTKPRSTSWATAPATPSG